ncbi:hypothetical protein F2981_26660 (plasmid) [Sinorhizobium meliloti]|nr:hypothetical protein [Sinorhizobium meliloti]
MSVSLPQGAAPSSASSIPVRFRGHTFAAQRCRLAMAVNNIRSRQTETGMPRMVLCRAVLDCGTVREALDMLRSSQRAAAFHISWRSPENRGHSQRRVYPIRPVRSAEVDAPEVQRTNHLIPRRHARGAPARHRLFPAPDRNVERKILGRRRDWRSNLLRSFGPAADGLADLSRTA